MGSSLGIQLCSEGASGESGVAGPGGRGRPGGRSAHLFACVRRGAVAEPGGGRERGAGSCGVLGSEGWSSPRRPRGAGRRALGDSPGAEGRRHVVPEPHPDPQPPPAAAHARGRAAARLHHAHQRGLGPQPAAGAEPPAQGHVAAEHHPGRHPQHSRPGQRRAGPAAAAQVGRAARRQRRRRGLLPRPGPASGRGARGAPRRSSASPDDSHARRG